MTNREKFIDKLLHDDIAQKVIKDEMLVNEFIKTCKQVLNLEILKDDVICANQRFQYPCHGIVIKGTPTYWEGRFNFIILEAVFRKPKRYWWKVWGKKITVVQDAKQLGSPRDLAFILDKYGDYNLEY
jgi:hypothetical protein